MHKSKLKKKKKPSAKSMFLLPAIEYLAKINKIETHRHPSLMIKFKTRR